MTIDFARVRSWLKEAQLQRLFTQELGWDYHTLHLEVPLGGAVYRLSAFAQKRGVVAFLCESADGRIPDYGTRGKIERQVARSVREHLIVFVDADRANQVWQWVKREAGKPTARREHSFHRGQSGDALLQKLDRLAFALEEEERVTLPDVTGRQRAAFDVERVTKRFYDLFQKEHAAFLGFLRGIPEEGMQRWYVSVMLNRLMFVYFIQKKGFLDGNTDYLTTKLAEMRRRGPDLYYSDFLCPLFFEGFARRESERSPETNRLLGKVPYLDGGLFQRHQIEELHGREIRIPDAAFERLYAFFDRYQWHLDERPLRADNEINPDVLGYIFEKYINQKEMGAYYTKEDITSYIARNTVIPFLFDAARPECRIAFEGERTVWDLLRADPDRYVYESVRKGVELPLPPEIAVGLEDVSRRTEWNRPAPPEYALPTEIWREVVARRKRYQEVRAKLAAGEVRSVDDLITYNLDIVQFAQDVIESSEGPELLRAFWRAVGRVTVLDPTVGSGAFLFAALNLLEGLYEACLERMEAFLAELERSGERHRPERYSDFRKVLDRVAQHPNRRYFVLKSIVVNNLYGVDIMEEAVEICKLRLFLKLVAQVERVEDVEPLPDIDFNVRAGNTLVGFASYDQVKEAVTKKFDFYDTMGRIEEAAGDVDRLAARFREQQTEIGGRVTPADKRALRDRLRVLEEELNRYLAGEYGVDPDDADAYRRWLDSHRPFHWFVEFYGIMKRGGFDVIIGNPPYVELSALLAYTVRGYQCEAAGNLYALVMERCFGLCGGCGRQGFIVPVSSVSTDRYLPLQRMVGARRVHYSSFDDRPSRLFEGLEHIRLTIHLIGPRSVGYPALSTRYNKWHSAERATLFDRLVYAPAHPVLVEGSMPKLSHDAEEGVVRKLRAQGRCLSSYYRRGTPHRVFYSRKVGYFLQVLDFQPRVTDGRGILRLPSEFKELTFGTATQAAVALCCLNSSLFYWFVTVFSDCRHVNKREVDSFPVNIDRLVEQPWGKDLVGLGGELMADLRRNSEPRTMSFSHNTLTVECIIPKLSKPIIDEIDRVLARHYGFTEEELDFIINYDIKYRMGRDGSGEGE